jgi:CBS domain-containing protein
MDLTVLQAKRYGTFTCTSTTSLQVAAQKMVEEDISCLVVVDHQGYLAGVITRADLLRAFLNAPDWANHPVEDYMSRNVVAVSPSDRLQHVAQLLVEKQIHRVVIVQKEQENLRPVGVISDSDLVYHMIQGS